MPNIQECEDTDRNGEDQPDPCLENVEHHPRKELPNHAYHLLHFSASVGPPNVKASRDNHGNDPDNSRQESNQIVTLALKTENAHNFEHRENQGFQEDPASQGNEGIEVQTKLATRKDPGISIARFCHQNERKNHRQKNIQPLSRQVSIDNRTNFH